MTFSTKYCILVATMYITRTKKKVGDKTYRSILLVRSVRKNGLPRHETILNLSNWDEQHIEALEQSLKGKSLQKDSINLEEVESKTGRSIGGLLVVKHLAKTLGITEALGTTEEAKLAMVLIAGRLLTQGSRLKLCEWQEMAEVEAVFGKRYTQYDLYDALDWVAKNQAKIETRLFKKRYPDECKKPSLFLYDITSSYLEGDQNELGRYGYNRDGKKGKKQIVIGLLTDLEGIPISVEVFEGNRSDCTTVMDQVEKMAERFGVTDLVLVGDKGMIKKTQITAFKQNTHYITSITHQQIRSLVAEGIIQLSLFENELLEVEHEGIRYILRKNPIRAQDMQESREERLMYMQSQIDKANDYLKAHTRSKTETHQSKLQTRLNRLKLGSFCEIESKDGVLTLQIDLAKKTHLADLDGCYVIKTDLSKEALSAQKVHECYKRLAQVEYAFRSIKTGYLELRPIYVRKESRTRGHVFIAMLAYMIFQAFSQAIKPLSLTTEAALDHVSLLQTTELTFGKLAVKKIQTPSSTCLAIFQALNLKIPNFTFDPVA